MMLLPPVPRSPIVNTREFPLLAEPIPGRGGEQLVL